MISTGLAKGVGGLGVHVLFDKLLQSGIFVPVGVVEMLHCVVFGEMNGRAVVVVVGKRMVVVRSSFIVGGWKFGVRICGMETFFLVYLSGVFIVGRK